MAVTFFLRRTNDSAGRDEYLFLSMETLNFDIDNDGVNVSAPGNTSADLEGDTGTNFNIELGIQRKTIRASGRIVGLDAADYPDLSGVAGTNHYITGSGTSATAPTESGRDVRWALLQYVADQADSDTYSAFKLGWPDFDSTGTDTIDGQVYRLFEGSIRSVRTEEQAGEIDQYRAALDFFVGTQT